MKKMTDVKFATEMIPHHQMAIDMANGLLGSGTEPAPEIAAIARNILVTQRAEIDEMQKWLDSRGDDAQTKSSPRRGGGMDLKNKKSARPERSFAITRLEIKKASPDGKVDGEAGEPDGSFDGYGALFNSPHPTSAWSLPPDWMDLVAPGAFKRTMGEHKARGTMPALLWMHDLADPMGAWNDISEDKIGLAVDGQLCLDVQTIKDRHALMKMGAAKGLSIGFVPVKTEIDEKAKQRRILDVDLFEISVVTIPGDPSAGVTDMKSFDPSNIRELEGALRDAGLSSTEAKRLLAGGFKALSQRDADDDETAQAFEKLMKALKGE